MQTVRTCPVRFGQPAECETIRDGVLYRCPGYIKMTGKNPQSDKIYDQEDCVLTWIPILLVELSQQVRGNSGAIESMRDETIFRQQRAMDTINRMGDSLGMINAKSLADS